MNGIPRRILVPLLLLGLTAGTTLGDKPNVRQQLGTPAMIDRGDRLPSGPSVASEPLDRSDFAPAAPQGFGDRDNAQTWGMAWFKGALYVGTGRATYCVQQATLELFQPFPDPYPPQDEDVICPPDPHEIPLRAEIWRWTPRDDQWTRVYQSPEDVPIKGTELFTARDIGYRGMLVFPEPQLDGTLEDVLYISGVSSRGAQGSGFNGPVPPPRILRTADGETFTPIPQDPGTFMGDTLVSGFRTMKLYKGKLYVVASVGLLGHGLIFESEQPWLGNDAFRQISPEGVNFFEIETYNGHLFAGTGGQPANGDPPFRLLKTDAEGDLPYTFTEIIPEAGYRPFLKSAAVIALREFKNHLFVGTDRELFRVNPDDSWDLIVGSPRDTPDGFKTPLGGLNIGFDNIFGIHMWRMATNDGWLYIGTQDQSTKWRNLLLVNLWLEPGLGFDLYATNDGWHFTRISRTGFGDLFNNGARNMISTPRGFFLGTANHYFGMQLFRAPRLSELSTEVLRAPGTVEMEVAGDRGILSWEAVPGATRYQVYRDTWFAESNPIATVPASPDEILFHVDADSDHTKQHHYFIIAEDDKGNVSSRSGIGRTPAISFTPNFPRLEQLLIAGGTPARIMTVYRSAEAAMAARDYESAVARLRRVRGMLRGFDLGALEQWRAVDFDILVAKLIRRILLAKAGALPDAVVLG
jgi:hypothetical protein